MKNKGTAALLGVFNVFCMNSFATDRSVKLEEHEREVKTAKEYILYGISDLYPYGSSKNINNGILTDSGLHIERYPCENNQHPIKSMNIWGFCSGKWEDEDLVFEMWDAAMRKVLTRVYPLKEDFNAAKEAYRTDAALVQGGVLWGEPHSTQKSCWPTFKQSDKLMTSAPFVGTKSAHKPGDSVYYSAPQGKGGMFAKNQRMYVIEDCPSRYSKENLRKIKLAYYYSDNPIVMAIIRRFTSYVVVTQSLMTRLWEMKLEHGQSSLKPCCSKDVVCRYYFHVNNDRDHAEFAFADEQPGREIYCHQCSMLSPAVQFVNNCLIDCENAKVVQAPLSMKSVAGACVATVALGGALYWGFKSKWGQAVHNVGKRLAVKYIH